LPEWPRFKRYSARAQNIICHPQIGAPRSGTMAWRTLTKPDGSLFQKMCRRSYLFPSSNNNLGAQDLQNAFFIEDSAGWALPAEFTDEGHPRVEHSGHRFSTQLSGPTGIARSSSASCAVTGPKLTSLAMDNVYAPIRMFFRDFRGGDVA